ncbi:MAG: phosphatidate cytidylyltransferase [Eubacteriales bacterium]
MKTRILVGVPIGLLVIAALILQSWVLVALFMFISIVGVYELTHALEQNGSKVVKSVPFVFTVASLPVLYFVSNMINIGVLFVLFVCCVIALFIIAMFSKKYDFQSLLKSVFALVYPQLFIMFAFLILFQFTNMQFFGTNPIVLVMAIVPTVFCDIFAYFFGRAFGKKKLCPDISPKKTVAGSVWGLIGGVLAAFLIWLFMASGLVVNTLSWDMDVVNFLVLGAAVAGVSQFGDLAASFIKRYFAIKDYGKILPGHGGILDRVDSILFALPVVYIYFVMYNAYAAAMH